MTSRYRAYRFLLFFLLSSLGTGCATAWSQNLSHVRIVRLSFVEGPVQVQRSDAEEWADAVVNTPIQEGFRVATGEGGFAEIEFENASTARIGQDSLLEFTQLALDENGGKINRLTLQKGYGTFHIMPGRDDQYEVLTPSGKVTPQGNTEFRVDIDNAAERLEVFSGSAYVESNLGGGTVAKDNTVVMDPNAAESWAIAQGITKDDWDQWVDNREEVLTAAYNRSPSPPVGGGYNSLYGWNDLDYYGSWSMLSGYGMCWVPNASEGWSPFTVGQWAWYPGLGFTWISYEPWGWLPYHSGNWNYAPGMGWFWNPNNLGAWYPAQVVWFQGPGWVGWAPGRRAGNGAVTSSCANSAGCVTRVSVARFTNGGPINGGDILRIKSGGGQPVSQPGIHPTGRMTLPGLPTTGGDRVGRVSPVGGGGRPAAGFHGGEPSRGGEVNAPAPGNGRQASSAFAAHGSATPGNSIAFDSVTGKYVNNPNIPPVEKGPGRVLNAPGNPARPAGDSPQHLMPVPGSSWSGDSRPKQGSAAGSVTGTPAWTTGGAVLPRSSAGGANPGRSTSSTSSGSQGGGVGGSRSAPAWGGGSSSGGSPSRSSGTWGGSSASSGSGGGGHASSGGGGGGHSSGGGGSSSGGGGSGHSSSGGGGGGSSAGHH